MKTKKDLVYALMCSHYAEGRSRGATTQMLSDTLNLQRSNVSTILNSLVKEGLVCKTGGRPVLYYAKRQRDAAESCFENLIGHTGSLKNAVQLAKAAVLYPQGGLNALIIGARGTGKKLLAYVMHRYAVVAGVVKADSPYRTVDCRAYHTDTLADGLFGAGKTSGKTSGGGILVLTNAQLLDAVQMGRILDMAQETGADSSGDGLSMVLALADGAGRAVEEMRRMLPITIELPALKQRPLEERLSIIQSFLVLEAARAHRIIAVNAELMRCLLLYEAEHNIASLKYDVKIGCANAYVREHSIQSDVMNLYMGDFEPYIRKGFLNYRTHREEIERIIPADYSYRFDENSFKMTAIDKDKLKGKTMYSIIDQRARQLAGQGVASGDINLLLAGELESMHRAYQNELASQVASGDQLTRLVDARILAVVRDFMEKASRELERDFPPSVFHGLCLHLEITMKSGEKTPRLSEEQIREITENYRQEYGLCMQLAAVIEKEFQVRLPTEEIVLLTMFISFKAAPADAGGKPTVLYVLQGQGLAAAYAALANRALQADNTYCFELSPDDDPAEIYDSLRDYIGKIDRGAGVIVVYDAEYMGQVFGAIEAELRIQIRALYMPFTRLALNLSRAAATERDIDRVYESVSRSLEALAKPRGNVIITLCATGEGGAAEVKRYIERYMETGDTAVVAFAVSNPDDLRENLSRVLEYADIQCVVGTYDPEMFGIPFVPISEIFSAPPENLRLVLDTAHRAKTRQMGRLNVDEIYSYLDESLENLDIGKLKNLLPGVLEEINAQIAPLSFDTEIGLFLHIPCSIERFLSRGKTQECIQKAQILSTYAGEYRTLLKILRPLEKAYKIIFTDDELAILLTIIYKL